MFYSFGKMHFVKYFIMNYKVTHMYMILKNKIKSTYQQKLKNTSLFYCGFPSFCVTTYFPR